MIITKFNAEELAFITEEIDRGYKNHYDAEATDRYAHLRDLFLKVTEMILDGIIERHKEELTSTEAIIEDALEQTSYFVEYCYMDLCRYLNDALQDDMEAIVEMQSNTNDNDLLTIKTSWRGYKYVKWNFANNLAWRKYLTFDVDALMEEYEYIFDAPVRYKFWNKPLKKYIIEEVIDWHISVLDAEGQKKLKTKLTKLINRYDYVTKYNPESFDEGENKELEEVLNIVGTNGLFTRESPLTTPKKIGMPSNKLTKTITNTETRYKTKEVKEGEKTLLKKSWGIDISSRGKKSPSVIINASILLDAETSKELDGFDCTLINCISSLFLNHKRNRPNEPFCISVNELHRLINGKPLTDNKHKPSTEQADRIINSMDTMRKIEISLDVTDEINKHGATFDDERLKSGRVETVLLKADKGCFETQKGNESIGYKIDELPILYAYSSSRKKPQLSYIDYKYFDTSNFTGNGGYTIEFRAYLLQQISLMATYRDSNIVLIDTIYKAQRIPRPEERISRENYTKESTYKTKIRQETKKDREKIEALLKAFTDKGLINGYSPIIEKNKQVVGYSIQLVKSKKMTEEIEQNDDEK